MHPTIQFLEALGKDSVFIRSWLGKGCPDVPNLYQGKPGSAYNVRCDRAGNSTDHMQWQKKDWERMLLELTRQNNPVFKPVKSFPFQEGGWVPYAVINDGGHKKAEIETCHALFIEFDAPITKEEALAKVNAFGLTPSAVIESRAGIHVYYFLEKPTTPKLWQQFQYRLIEQFESDSGIADYSRCMRLPGFYHLKQGLDPFMVKLIECHAGRRYSLEQFDALLPDVPDWRLKLDRVGKDFESFQNELQASWDIRDFKHVLRHYKPNARREWDTCQCPVHGSEGHSTDSLHINSVTGHFKCHAGCDGKEIYKEICRLAGWERPKPGKTQSKGVTTSEITVKEAPKPAAVKLSGEALLTKIDGLLDMEVSGSRLSAFISDLATQSGRQPRDIRDLFAQRQQERDLAETVDDRKANIDTWMKLKERKIHLKDFLHPDFATPLAAVYDQMHVPQAVALYTILPVMLSLCKIGTRLAVIPATNFYALPILYTGIVGESGSGKSPAMKIIMSALDELQAEAHEEYEAAMEQFDESLEEWTNGDRKNRGKKPKPPVERQYFVKDFTPESVAMIQSQQPDRGLLNYQDELSTIVTSRGKYSNGKGSDKENMLSGKDGSGIKVNRASGKSIYVKSTSVSIVGSTQPDTLKAMMGDFSDGAGEWARFLWTMIPLQSRPKPKNPVKYDISELLKAFFVEISNLPAETYVMSPEADRLYSEFHDQLDKRRQDEPRQAMRAVYSKMQGDVAIVMLAFHLINSLAAGNTPTIQVGAEAAAKAIAFAKDAINNVRQIHLLGDDGKKDISPLDMMQRIITLSERKGWLDASTAKQGIWKCQLSTVEIRTLFHEMANDFGIGQLRGEGKSMQWCVGTTETQSENMEATAVPPVVSEPESPPPEPSPPPEIEQVSEPLPEPELVSVQESVAVAVTQTEQRPKSEPVTSKLEQLRDALDPSLPLTVESITRKKDGAVFRVGDLIQIAIDHMDEIDQRDVLKHDGTPVGAITRIEKFELNDAGLFMKRAIYAPHMRVNGRTVSVPETYLRHVQQE